MPNVVNFVLRGFQILFAAVILGLSVSLVKGQWEDTKPPITLQYAAFVGGITLVAAVVGLASEWVTVLQGKIGFIIDGATTVVNLAGGVLLGIMIGGVSCGDTSAENRVKLLENDLFNGGCRKADDGTTYCYNEFSARWKYLNSRCRECTADSVFMFLTFGILVTSTAMAYRHAKNPY